MKIKLPGIAKTLKLTRRAILAGSIASIAITGPAEAILFSGAAISGGGGATTIDTMTLKTKSGGNIASSQPFQFGLPFAPGVVAQTDKIQLLDGAGATLTIQEDNRVVDANGSVRWIFATTVGGTGPGTASETITYQKLTGTPDTSNPITTANLLAQTISGDTFEYQRTITMPDGTVYVAKATDGLNASTTWAYGSPWMQGYHRQGPLCTEFVLLVPFKTSPGGVAHPYLYCEFHIAAYKASNAAWNNSTNPITGVKVYAFNHNGFNGTSVGWTGTPSDYVYDLVDKVGASTLATVLSLTGGSTTGNLTLGATTGITDATRASGTFGYSATVPNTNDCGKAIVELSGSATGRAYMAQYDTTTHMYCFIPTAYPFTGTTVTSWKTMGVYHYANSRVSNTHPAIGGCWWGTNSDTVYPILKSSYLKLSQMMPNYTLNSTQAAAPDLTQVNRDGCHPCGMSMNSGFIKNYALDEGATGGADHIGVFTYQQANACINWDSANHADARYLILANAEVGHRKPYCILNEEYGTQNGMADGGVYYWPAYGSNDVMLNVYSGGSRPWFTFATNHSGQTNAMPYIVTGDLYHLQDLRSVDLTYSMLGGAGYGFINTATVAVTISGSTITGPGTLPNQTGEAVNLNSLTNSFVAIGGVGQGNGLRAFYRAATSNTGSVYDTMAHALAGGATGLITFSSGGANIVLGNGYMLTLIPPKSNGAQTRNAAWNWRSVTQSAALIPTSPVSNLIAFDVNQTNMRRRLANLGKWANDNYVSNVNYQAGGPRFLFLHNATNGGTFQQNYIRQALLNGVESGAYATGDTNTNFLDWFLADAIQWHVRTSDSFPGAYCSSYYFVVGTDIGINDGTPAGYSYATIYNTAIGTPFRTIAFGRYPNPTGFTATISSVAVPSAVTVTLNTPYFDTGNKTPYEGKAWLAVGSGCGQIVTVNSSTQVVIDCTVATWYGISTGNATPGTGSGQSVVLPLPSPGNGATVVPSIDLQYFSSSGMGTNTAGYAYLDKSSIEIAKQRGIDTANYTAAFAEMTGRGFPSSYGPGQTNEAVMYNLTAR